MPNLVLSALHLLLIAHCASSACSGIRGVNSPVNLVNKFLEGLFSSLDLANKGEDVRILTLLQNSSSTRYKVIFQVSGAQAGVHKYFIGVQSELTETLSTASHRIVQFLQTENWEDVVKLLGVSQEQQFNIKCDNTKNDFIDYFVENTLVVGWFNKYFKVDVVDKARQSADQASLVNAQQLSKDSETQKAQISKLTAQISALQAQSAPASKSNNKPDALGHKAPQPEGVINYQSMASGIGPINEIMTHQKREIESMKEKQSGLVWELSETKKQLAASHQEIQQIAKLKKELEQMKSLVLQSRQTKSIAEDKKFVDSLEAQSQQQQNRVAQQNGTTQSRPQNRIESSGSAMSQTHRSSQQQQTAGNDSTLAVPKESGLVEDSLALVAKFLNTQPTALKALSSDKLMVIMEAMKMQEQKKEGVNEKSAKNLGSARPSSSQAVPNDSPFTIFNVDMMTSNSPGTAMQDTLKNVQMLDKRALQSGQQNAEVEDADFRQTPFIVMS